MDTLSLCVKIKQTTLIYQQEQNKTKLQAKFDLGRILFHGKRRLG